jgi:N6-adenosine-specific RNA methylase IME4/ParB-like chromosome segregation protein Spo0J
VLHFRAPIEEAAAPADLPAHPLADLFPLIEGEEFEALVWDICERGLREPIVLYEGAILDGRNRYRAARQANVPCRFETYDGDDPAAYVVSLNLRRRHLNESQRAMVAAKLANLQRGRPKENAPIGAFNLSQNDVADRLNVSRRSVQRAAVVREKGTEELRRAVEQGHLAVDAAARAAVLAPEIQDRIAGEAKAGRANVVKLVVKQERRALREREIGERQCASPEGLFGVIVEDFEHDFEVYSRETGMDRHAANHYETASDAHTPEEIVARTRDRFACAAPDCVLGMWTTIPHLAISLEVMRLRGFKYVSHCIWEKDRIITGFWFRAKHEILLIGVRGDVPCPAPGTQFVSIIRAPAGKHSEKPEIFLEWFEHFFKTWRKLELNSRRDREGWTAWGNEAGKRTGAA